MIVDVDLVVFNCVFSRALDLNLCYIKDMISHIIVHIILFFEKKAPGRPGGFTQDAAFWGIILLGVFTDYRTFGKVLPNSLPW